LRNTVELKSWSEVVLTPEDSLRLKSGEVVTGSKEGVILAYVALPNEELLAMGPSRRDLRAQVWGGGNPSRWTGKGTWDNRRLFWWGETDSLAERDGLRIGDWRGWGGPVAQQSVSDYQNSFRPSFFRDSYFVLLVLLALVLMLIGVAIYLLIRPLEKRIYALANVTEQFGEGDLDIRAPVKSSDSISELSQTFNAMAEQIEDLVTGQQELLRAVSHELRTPLSRLFFILDEAQDADTVQEKDHYLQRTQNSLNDMSELLEELLAYTRLGREVAAPIFESIDVYAAVWDMPNVVAELRTNISIDVQCQEITFVGMPRYFKRALQNLVTNAVRHANTHIWIRGVLETDRLLLVVEDDGVGIPESQRERIFEPFARLDESRTEKLGGAGLGLAIVERIMNLHGGEVAVDDSPQGGARFTLQFPMKALQ
jgi:signal transduction histidine kinase